MRRRKAIRISDRFLADLFREGARTYRVVKDAVPADAQVVSVHFDFSMAPAMIFMLVESDSFDEVPEGQPWPILDPKMETIAIPDSAKFGESPIRAAIREICDRQDISGSGDYFGPPRSPSRSWSFPTNASP